MRFDLRKMFVGIAMLALACAGMMYRTYWWASGIVTFTWLLVLWAGVHAIIRHGRTRVAWTAFLLAAASYMVFSARSMYGPVLLTNFPIAIIARQLEIGGIFVFIKGWASGMAPNNVPLDQVITAAYGTQRCDAVPQLREFFVIGHCVFSWLFAVLAAWIASQMYDRRLASEDTVRK